jgi:hypothetical protein
MVFSRFHDDEVREGLTVLIRRAAGTSGALIAAPRRSAGTGSAFAQGFDLSEGELSLPQEYLRILYSYV